MSVTRIRIQEEQGHGDQRRIVIHPEFPEDVPNRTVPREINCDPQGAPFSDLTAISAGERGPLANDLVRTVGDRIYSELSTHLGVEQALSRAIHTPPGVTHEIHLLTSLGEAEGLPWEAIHHAQAHFLGLDERWPFSRLVNGPPTPKLVRFVEPPLRMVAVIAAADRDGVGEWEAIRQAVLTSGLSVHLVVFLADDALRAHIGATGGEWCETRYVPDTPDALVAEFARCRPQLLHIYAHGSSQYAGYLEIDTRGRSVGQPAVYLTADGLQALRDELLLVTLNACEGAAPSNNIRSIAYGLASKGVPAVIGMREAIDARDASLFSGAFYGAAFAALKRTIVPGGRVRVDWAGPLQVARRALCKRLAGPTTVTAARQKSWTLPVLYRITEEIWIRVADPTLSISSAEQEMIVSEIEHLRAILHGLPPDTPRGRLDLFNELIAKYEARLV